MRICEVENCKNEYRAKGYCNKHWAQVNRHGRIMRTRFDKNEYIDCGEYYEICLYNKKQKEVARAIINKKKYNKVKDYKWSLNNKGYVITRINKNETLFLHHLVKPRHKYLDTDHEDVNPLNNRINNLRYLTRSQNLMNRKEISGIDLHKQTGKWRARIKINKKEFHLGLFTNKQDAINARRKAEQKYFGEFAFKH